MPPAARSARPCAASPARSRGRPRGWPRRGAGSSRGPRARPRSAPRPSAHPARWPARAPGRRRRRRCRARACAAAACPAGRRRARPARHDAGVDAARDAEHGAPAAERGHRLADAVGQPLRGCFEIECERVRGGHQVMATLTQRIARKRAVLAVRLARPGRSSRLVGGVPAARRLAARRALALGLGGRPLAGARARRPARRILGQRARRSARPGARLAASRLRSWLRRAEAVTISQPSPLMREARRSAMRLRAASS